ncbi:MAG: hypothetical protein ACI89D_001977 [Bermanella sp.]|jgi:hypothetical protein
MTVNVSHFVLLHFIVAANMNSYESARQPRREYQTMSQSFSTHVYREALSNGFTNAFFNGVIAWYLVKHRDLIPVWGAEGLAVDFTATSIILVFIVSLIVIPLARRKVRKGDFPFVDWPAGALRNFLGFMAQRHLAVCALMLGLLSALLFVPPMLLLTQVLEISTFSAQHFAVVKGIWAGIVAAAMVVAMLSIVTVAKQDAEPSTETKY